MNKWIELGTALGVPIEKLERINDKHRDNPFNGLVRVYRYWLADKNSLMPTWKKLIDALYKIDEYSLAASVVNAMVSNNSYPIIVLIMCIANDTYIHTMATTLAVNTVTVAIN